MPSHLQPVQPVRLRKAISEPNVLPIGTLSRNHHLEVMWVRLFVSALCQGTTTLERTYSSPVWYFVKEPPPWSASPPPLITVAPSQPVSSPSYLRTSTFNKGALSRNHHLGVPQRSARQGTTTLGHLFICLLSQCRSSHRLNLSRHRHLDLDPKCYPGLAHGLSFSLNNCSDRLRLIVDCLVVKCCIWISPATGLAIGYLD
jgi:hypothetical protein